MKYRIWSNKLKIWITHTALLTGSGEFISLHFEQDEVTKKVNPVVHKIDVLEPVVELWTGLKDKKGNEIYEGDILKKYYNIKYDPKDYPKEPKSYLCELYLYDSQWRMKYGTASPQDVPFSRSTVENYEIVGNIHENPELRPKQETNE
jgi:uncharacterized phage protein (TIGR01671 family)